MSIHIILIIHYVLNLKTYEKIKNLKEKNAKLQKYFDNLFLFITLKQYIILQ